MAVDVLRVESLKDSTLVGWVPALVKELNPTKGVLVTYRDEKKTEAWIEKHTSVAPSERHTKDWDWRYILKRLEQVDACDDFGHWYLSTVLDCTKAPSTSSSDERDLAKVKVAYRCYLPTGTKTDSQGQTYEGWSETYDEWISANSLRLQRFVQAPLTV